MPCEAVVRGEAAIDPAVQHHLVDALATAARWRVQKANSGRGYTIIPGTNDGTARGDAYAKGDVWLLRYRRGQIDDYPLAGGTEIQIDKYLNRESIHRQDVVVWYGAHFTHDASQEGAGAGHDHIFGPDLVPHDL